MLGKLARDLARRVYGRQNGNAAPARAAQHPPFGFEQCLALSDAGRIDEARDCYRALIEREPRNAAAYNNLGLILQREDALDEAACMFRRALSVDPERSEAHLNLANVLQEQRELNAALAEYDAAVRLAPESPKARYGRATTLLALGRFEEGWKEYAWRLRLGESSGAPAPDVQHWHRSEDLHGRRFLIRTEQGFGDTIQFIRYAPLLAARGVSVVVECLSALRSLLSRVDGVRETVRVGDARARCDYALSIMDLPAAFGTEPASIPADVPYVRVAEADVQRWRQRLQPTAGKLRVGVAWRGNPQHANDGRRSLPLEQAAELLHARDCAFVSLQKGPGEADSAALVRAGLELHDFSRDFTDFAETAACISALDVVVCVDTAVAHLAGALARPVILMLPFSPDWRWWLAEETTPWYPTMRLVRQPSPGDWRHVIDEVKRDLELRSRARAAPPEHGRSS